MPIIVLPLLLALVASSAGSSDPTVPRTLTPGTLPGEVTDSVSFIRVNQVGYLPEGPKTAVVCSLEPRSFHTFAVVDERGSTVTRGAAAQGGAFGPCASTHRLDFGSFRLPGRYRVVLGDLSSPTFRISEGVYAGGADTLLHYMRQQRSGYNPLFRDSVHHRTDGILVDHPRAGEFIPVTGGWHDAADYLQYVTTSANATFVMLMAYRDHPGAIADRFDARGDPGANGIADVLDEARHGLEWLVSMFPEPELMLNQLGDDRDHMYFDLPTTDSSDYGWGKGGYRPVYPCTGRPQGLLEHRNRANGYASTAGKYASAMALGAQLLGRGDPEFAAVLTEKARQAYELGRRYPVVAHEMGVETQLGGLLDGPVYRTIFENLQHVRLINPDRYARFNTGFIVFHDDFGDYSTNEPIMDGTANLTYLLAALARENSVRAPQGVTARGDGR